MDKLEGPEKRTSLPDLNINCRVYGASLWGEKEKERGSFLENKLTSLCIGCSNDKGQKAMAHGQLSLSIMA